MPHPVAKPHRTFTTAGLGKARRFALWEQHNEETLVRLACRSISQAPFEGRETSLQLGDFKIANITTSAHVVERDRRLITRYESGRVALYFTVFGDSCFYHDKGIQLLRPGTLLLCDLDQPFLRGFVQGLQEYVLMLPKTTFEELTGGRAPQSPATVRFSHGPAGELARLLRDVLTAQLPAAPETEARIRTLVAGLYSCERNLRAAEYRREALAYIDRNLADRHLTVAAVAAEVGLSNRQLTRIFSKGGGVSRVIKERRLRSAFEQLRSDTAAPIARVAVSCGFASHAHFTRAFRDHFGVPPSAVRSHRPPAEAPPPLD